MESLFYIRSKLMTIKPSTNKLPAQEWIIVGLLIAIMGLIVIVTLPKSYKPDLKVPQEVIVSEIEVRIEGAVSKPGIYVLKKGTCIKELLEKAIPLPEACLGKINQNKELYDGQKIKINAKAMITVFIEGASKQNGPLIIPQGTKLEELIALLEFESNADIQSLNKKRRLKDQEVIHVYTQGENMQPKKSKKKKRKKSACTKKSSLITSLFQLDSLYRKAIK